MKKDEEEEEEIERKKIRGRNCFENGPKLGDFWLCEENQDN